jgi:rubredoxin
VQEISQRCPSCGSERIDGYSTLHHYLCSYVGPQYDFGTVDDFFICPKCKMKLEKEYQDWEIVGFCNKCHACGYEFIDESFQKLP